MQTYQTTASEYAHDSITTTSGSGIKWNEVLSLGGLNVALAISWIAYLEYQPVILQKFGAVHLANFLLFAKAIILVVVPILSGWAADKILAKKGRFFMVFMVGISTTAMIFMIVASLITMGPGGAFAGILPIMIVLWLISMSIFIAPAFSMIERFASKQKLPVVMGVIILITEVIYALEPLVIELVRFFGETLTFIVGGVLVLGTGILFKRLTTDEVEERTELFKDYAGSTTSPYMIIALLGLALGIGRAVLVEFVPANSGIAFLSGKQLSFILLALSALVAFGMSRKVSSNSTRRYLVVSILLMLTGTTLCLLSGESSWAYLTGVVVTAFSLGIAHLCGLPFAFGKLNPRNTTIGIGLFLGASAVAEGIFELWYAI